MHYVSSTLMSKTYARDARLFEHPKVNVNIVFIKDIKELFGEIQNPIIKKINKIRREGNFPNLLKKTCQKPKTKVIFMVKV